MTILEQLCVKFVMQLLKCKIILSDSYVAYSMFALPMQYNFT